MEIVGLSWELIFIVDGEGSLAWRGYIEEISDQPHVRAILLGRNVGQHAAIRFGLGQAGGEVAYVMDCDLQDPPEIIPEILAPLISGEVDVVLTHRRGHETESSLRLFRWMYNRVAKVVTGLDIHYALGPVVALSPRAISYVKMFREEAHTLQILAWLELPSRVISYERQSRPRGQSSYSRRARLRHAVSGMSFSTARILGYIFVASLALAVSALILLFVLTALLVSGSPPSGWLSLITVSVIGFASISMLVSFTGGLVIQALNLLRQRPNAVVTDTWSGQCH